MTSCARKSKENLMDTAEIQKRIDVMPAAMSAKGLIEPEASFTATANGQPRVAIHWYRTVADRQKYNGTGEWFREGTILERLDAADAFIAALPGREEVKFKEFMVALGGVIDLGKDNGIEVEFLNPLRATMKKLSENALTFQPSASLSASQKEQA